MQEDAVFILPLETCPHLPYPAMLLDGPTVERLLADGDHFTLLQPEGRIDHCQAYGVDLSRRDRLRILDAATKQSMLSIRFESANIYPQDWWHAVHKARHMILILGAVANLAMPSPDGDMLYWLYGHARAAVLSLAVYTWGSGVGMLMPGQ
ncbi:hypothetical protein [Bifidobacterium animalis]|uniref:hypothetical protein n=1 Tax=Bifidobacterium animalis TaxID=28025 RepID=UPI001C3EA7F7|nr:hypothetical protein [Bifidobacterium animalis]